MQTRRILAVVFVTLCLGLSGLLLRRQMAAHPLPRQSASDMFRAAPDPTIWHTDTGRIKKAVTGSILAQLAAIRTGDADKAIFYQSSGLRRRFSTPQQFVQTITTSYPEFGHSRSAEFGPVQVNKTGSRAMVIVTALGENGRRARGYYLLVREAGIFRVDGVEGGGAIN